MKLKPYAEVDGLPFTVRRADLQRRHGAPLRERGNGIGLTELDYGDVVFRFQDGSGRLEEVTRRAAVLYLLLDGDVVDVPFARLAAFVPAHDGAAFERAGFLVSPRFGLAFVPGQPDWVTALAAHCIETWRALPN
ncbi:hypothetical protein [Ottowia beijingensis]|uniref:hypothetical protein n=1 Tax=Ottowia beijingensis TaxID=1207057 RepID=UPI002FD8BEFF